MLGLHCCSGFSLVVASGGYPLVAVLRLLIAVAFLVAEHRLKGLQVSVVVAHRLRCPAALWDLTGSGIRPVSALADRFFTTKLPGKPVCCF